VSNRCRFRDDEDLSGLIDVIVGLRQRFAARPFEAHHYSLAEFQRLALFELCQPLGATVLLISGRPYRVPQFPPV
jgi:hypothetical protein